MFFFIGIGLIVLVAVALMRWELAERQKHTCPKCGKFLAEDEPECADCKILR